MQGNVIISETTRDAANATVDHKHTKTESPFGNTLMSIKHRASHCRFSVCKTIISETVRQFTAGLLQAAFARLTHLVPGGSGYISLCLPHVPIEYTFQNCFRWRAHLGGWFVIWQTCTLLSAFTRQQCYGRAAALYYAVILRYYDVNNTRHSSAQSAMNCNNDVVEKL